MDRKLNDWGGNILAFVLVITVNSLANIIPIGGQTTGGISAKYPTLFTPAGFTFSIWSVIYLTLFLFIIFQALKSQRNNRDIGKIHKMFVLNCLANAAWIFAWHFEFIFMSFIIMIIILVTLIFIYKSMNFNDSNLNKTFTLRLLVKLPFSIYTAWITVAFLANLSVLQSSLGWESLILSPINWTLFKLALTGAIGSLVLIIKKDFIYALVIAWACFGIYVKQMATPQISGTALSISIMMVILIVFEILRKRIGSVLHTTTQNHDK